MSNFIDDEADVASDNHESDSDDSFKDAGPSKKKQKTRPPKKSREAVDSSEEEEEDDEDDEEMADLINDEDDEEDESSDDDDEDEGGSNDDGSSSPDDEDLAIIQENTGVRIDKKKKFRRIRVENDDSEDEVDEARQIQNDLFGPSDLLESDDEDVQKQKSKPSETDLAIDDDESESESDDNFIVDDNDQPIARKSKKKGARYSDSAMQQAQEIFGVDFDYNEIDEDDEYEDEGGYEEEYDEETGEPIPRRKREGRKTIYDVYEPAELERSHVTAIDQLIKAKDEPERFQLRSVPVTEASDDEIKEEADWIFSNAFFGYSDERGTISLQERGHEPIAGKRSELWKPQIEYALKCIRNEKLEMSFIAAYRREYIPDFSHNFDDTKDLWTIYKYDEQWCKLQRSKKSIANLYRDMRNYLETRPEDSRIRLITNEDVKHIHEAKTFHDVEDCRLHFKLHYSHLTTEMKLYTLEQRITEQKAERANRPKKTRQENGGAHNADEGDNDEIHKPEEAEEDGDENDEPEETEEEKIFKKLSKFKISSSKDKYHAARQHYVGDLVKKFGLTPEKFGENLRDDYQVKSVDQHYTRPLDEAANHLKPGTRFATREEVLEAAKLMYSREISCDPLVRQTVRKHYFMNAVIKVQPTTLGLEEIIDENHPCYSFKFLRNKPVKDLSSDQFLHLLNAEKDKLLEIQFSIDPIIDAKEQISPFYESLKALFYSDFSSIVTKEWNETREEAIIAAMDRQILPCLEKQLRDLLIKEAQDKIIKDSCEKLDNWLNVRPFDPSQNHAHFDDFEDFELRNGTRICGFTFAPEGDAPCFAAIIDSEGELIDHIRLPYINIRKRADRLNASERENHAKDRAKFKQFVINKKPHVVALAAETIQTKYICQHLAQILDELHTHDGLPLIPIEIVDNEISNVYMNLKMANEEFPDFPPLLLQAISNARKLNDPLNECAKLCSLDHDILCIRFHPLQDDLPKETFLENIYNCFVTRTNAVGVDPNRAIAHPHTANLVQFIAGLGPRKGAHLLRSIKKSKTGVLVSRQQLVTELGMTACIFINCAGFIKLDTDTLSEDYPDDHITPLDSTRIHPQSYGLARKIAVDAVTEGEDDEGTTEETASNAIETIIDHPDKLNDLDLEAFAKELEEGQNLGKKGFTLDSIRDEFQTRYKDYRRAYQAPSQEAIFAMLTKETAQTFYIGKLITCQVVQIPRKKPGASQLDMANPVKIDVTNLWRCPFCMRSDFQDLSVVWNHFDTDDCPGYAIGVKCKLDNGLFGFVPTKFLSDKEISDPSERVAIGQVVHARVTKIDSEKFSVDLTCRTSDLLDESDRLKPPKDEYYDKNAEDEAREKRLKTKSKRNVRRNYCKRVIVHPAFENIDCKTCEKKLQEREQGNAIIRPSSQGQNYLTLSWKVADGIYQHITIREEGKENAFSLGHQLFIENEPYEDLDEIIARYVQPMASYARELLNYKHCIKSTDELKEDDIMQEALFKAKRASPCFPYRFYPSRAFPGKFLLGYMPKDRPKIEYLTVTSRGYRFRKITFKNLASLLKWFKANWNWTTNMMSIQGSVPMSQ